MTFSTLRAITAGPVTSINDWREILDRRLAAQRRRVTIPLELRLMLITTAVVIILVAAGTQVASAIGDRAALTASLRLHTTTTTLDSWRADGICYAASTAPQMISAAQLASAHTPGIRETQPGVYRTCQINGLIVPTPTMGVPTTASGQVILVSRSQQWLWAYDNGALVFANPVATGMPYLRTPLGAFHVRFKEANVTFYSPWPRSSQFYYSPEHIDYALSFRAGGFYIHDSPWRQMYGPGAEDPHALPGGGFESGSHGCVNMTTSAVAWLYQWAQVGATVEIVE